MTSDLARLTSALAGRYRVDREIGAGGMATVYLAQDLRHDRRVALKVLKPELSAVVGAERFLAEIRTTANLQHPHILSLFDSGAVDGTVFYVMPFVDGESLRDRLDRDRQLPVDEALRIAREIADALEYAHTHGVIHRDIKPENILLHGGHALVADFGIALAASNTAGGRMTETGMSLGTPTYMSPEQAMGERTLDARTDIYALGCVLYEMLVGEPPFTGATAQQVIARVLTEEPRSLSAQRKTVAPAVDEAVGAALSKLPADRPSSAAAFATMLANGSGATMHGTAARRSHERSRVSRTTLGLSVALLVTLGFAVSGWMRQPVAEDVTRSYMRFAPHEEPVPAADLALVPDGSAFVYVGGVTGVKGTQLWIKKRSELHATPVSGTVGARSAMVSPDGKWIGFFTGEKVKKVPIAGGDPVTITDAGCLGACDDLLQGRSTWLDDGRLVYRAHDALVGISASGGTADTLVTSQQIGGFSAVSPTPLPKSRGFLFTACTASCDQAHIYVYDFATRTVRKLLEHATFARYAEIDGTGELLYTDPDGGLHAMPFDAKAMTVSGTERLVLDHVAGSIAVTHGGMLAYLDGDPSPKSYLAIVSPSGAERRVDSSWTGNFATLAVSPDGKTLAATMVTQRGEEHVWVKPLGSSQQPTRLTFGAAQYTSPTFTADGKNLLMTRFANNASTFLMRRVDGNGPEVPLAQGKDWVIESTSSRDGMWRVTRGYRDGVRSIHAKRLGAGGDTAQRAVVSNGSSNFSPAISPDGKWLLYANDETGRPEVWAIPFPDANGAKWQVSNEGGMEPAWSADGHTIYYVDPSRRLVSVAVTTGPSFVTGARKALFDVRPYRRHFTHRAYDVLPDGNFVMIHEGMRGAGDLVLVENWFAELKRTVSPH